MYGIISHFTLTHFLFKRLLFFVLLFSLHYLKRGTEQKPCPLICVISFIQRNITELIRIPTRLFLYVCDMDMTCRSTYKDSSTYLCTRYQESQYHTVSVGTVEISFSGEQTDTGDPLFLIAFYTELFRVITGSSGHFGRNIDFGPKSVQKKISSLKLIFADRNPQIRDTDTMTKFRRSPPQHHFLVLLICISCSYWFVFSSSPNRLLVPVVWSFSMHF